MSSIGWLLGIAAAAALVVVMLYSARRSAPANRKLGPTRKYLELHIWGGIAFFALFLLHAGISPPDGALALLLWTFSMWVVITGAIGVALQRSVPKLLEPTSTFEVQLQRIPEFAGQLKERAEAAAATADPRVKSYYEQQLAADMAQPRMVAALLRNPRQVRRGAGDIDILRRTLAPEGLKSLDDLRELHATKHELDVHYTLQRILRGWLYLHLPVAITLLGLVVLHVFFVIYF